MTGSGPIRLRRDSPWRKNRGHWPVPGPGLAVAVALVMASGCATGPVSGPASAPPQSGASLWNQTRLEVALQLAADHLQAGKFDRARGVLGAHITAPDARVPLTLARIDLEEGQYDAALKRLESIPQQQRDSAGYHEAVALAQEGLGRWREAAEAYQRAYRCEPSATRLIAWLDTLVLAGRCEQARATLEAERWRIPGEISIADVAARLYAQLGQPDAAIAETCAALLDEPESTALRRRLAESYMAAGRYGEAIPIWRELAGSAREAGLRRDYRMRWAECLLATGQYAEASRIYRLLTLTDPQDADAHTGLAVAALANGEPQAALAAARRASELAPGNPDAQLALDCAYARADQFGTANLAPGGQAESREVPSPGDKPASQ